MSKAITIVGLLLLLSNTTGCAAIIAADAIGRHDDRRRQEIQYRHQERMRELDIQEKRLKLEYQQPQQADGGIVRETPY